MSKIRIAVITITLAAAAASGQISSSHCPVSGRVEPPGGSSEELYVELRELSNRMMVEKQPVGRDGEFQFRDVPAGSYEVRVITGTREETLTQEFVDVTPMTSRLFLRLPQSRKQQPVSGVISVEELQSTVPKKAFQAFVKAQHFTEADKPDQAIEQLRRAIAIDPQWRDAHVNLGVQLVRLSRFQEAATELETAIRIGPPSAIAYTNYGAALASLHRTEEGENAARQALRLNPTDQRSHYLLGHILAERGGKDAEALDHLQRASGDLPVAHIVAAQLLLKKGNRAGATAELHHYLSSGERAHRNEVEVSLAQLEGRK